jgi:hypothetical protein
LTRAVSLDDVRRAWGARDPELPALVVALAKAPDRDPDAAPRPEALTYPKFIGELRSWRFRHKPPEERARLRVERWKALEAEDAEVGLPDRLWLHAILRDLWEDRSPYARDCLVRIIADVPLVWGPWRALKQIFKEAEERGDDEVFGALAARVDAELAAWTPGREVSRQTLAYLSRRAWRSLRQRAQQLPATYPDAACAVLRAYTDRTNWSRTWLSNHIFFHETGKYTRGRFTFRRAPSDLLKHRAWAELWQRSPRPLFELLETARSELVRRYAAEALKKDFRAAIREVEPAWVARLVGVRSQTVDGFVVWILSNVPRFEQRAFRELGLHEPVLTLLDSPADEAREYAAAYARTHARDLALERLLVLANNDHKDVRKLAADLLKERDPRKDVGLDAWGSLLGTRYGHDLAADALAKHFGARELSPDWFRERLLSNDNKVFQFASGLVHKVHTRAALGAAWYRALLDDERLDWQVSNFATEALGRFPASEIGVDFLRRAMVHSQTRGAVTRWVNEEKVPSTEFGADFLKVLAYRPDWESSQWVAELRASGRRWALDLSFDENISQVALSWLSDVRKFTPDQLGFEWLLQLARRPEPGYHNFAVEYMIKAFLPADFAPSDGGGGGAAAADDGGEINVDLGGASFLFTGTLATMTRSEATKKVTAAGGANASGVNKKLDYLVIGDEGSPLYGNGRKGSKQVKAEKLIAEGAELKIISETAFLQMLAGKAREADTGASLVGAARLWEMATTGEATGGEMNDPLARFALRYIRRHHPDIGLALTDRPVDPGAEIPEDFLTFDQVAPLFADPRRPLRELALELASWELTRWAPPIAEVVSLCESRYPEVRALFSAALLLADDSPASARCRIDPATLTPAAVYRFCESLDDSTRDLGMELISRHPRFAIPEELFRLTESPDRQVRAFVIRTLWSLYRDRGITPGWKPEAAPAPKIGKKGKGADGEARDPGPGAPARPENLPADIAALQGFLRKILFALPPGRLPPRKGERLMKPLPARKAKLGLIEVLRDLAVEDAAVAGALTPALEEFMCSRGKSEHAACLVALTRIRAAHH